MNVSVSFSRLPCESAHRAFSTEGQRRCWKFEDTVQTGSNGERYPGSGVYGSTRDMRIKRKRDVKAARPLHSHTIKCGVDSISVFGDHLIRLFASCGSLVEANEVFSRVSQRSVYKGHAIMSAHTELGDGQRVLELYYRMQQEGMEPDRYTYICCSKACGIAGELKQGRLIHDHVIKSGLECDMAVGSTLIDMYSKCRSLEEAYTVFDTLPVRDAVSWGAMISGCAQQDSRIGNTLVNMYAKCGNLEEAHKVFTELPNRDIVSWCAMITAYAEQGYGLLALEFFKKMQQEGMKPDKVTLLCILKACSSIGALVQGQPGELEVA